MKNFVAMMVSTSEASFDRNAWYVVSPFSDPVTGGINFDFYRFDKYIESTEAGLRVERKEPESKETEYQEPEYHKNIIMGKL